jgi:hypothetical protein
MAARTIMLSSFFVMTVLLSFDLRHPRVERQPDCPLERAELNRRCASGLGTS